MDQPPNLRRLRNSSRVLKSFNSSRGCRKIKYQQINIWNSPKLEAKLQTLRAFRNRRAYKGMPSADFTNPRRPRLWRTAHTRVKSKTIHYTITTLAAAAPAKRWARSTSNSRATPASKKYNNIWLSSSLRTLPCKKFRRRIDTPNQNCWRKPKTINRNRWRPKLSRITISRSWDSQNSRWSWATGNPVNRLQPRIGRLPKQEGGCSLMVVSWRLVSWFWTQSCQIF